MRLLLIPTDEWDKTSRKTKLPKPKVDIAVLDVIQATLLRRLKEYPTTLEVSSQFHHTVRAH